MGKENPVYQVLVPKGNQAVLGVGLRVGSLAINQIGVFDYHTGLSVDVAAAATTEQFFLAVGTDYAGTGSLANVNLSAGQYIPKRRGTAITLKGYVPHVPKIIQVAGFSAKCDTDYGIKIEYRNSQIYGISGYNQFTKTYMYHTACCTDDCSACPTGDPNELAQGLINAINKDPDKLATASAFVNKISGTFSGTVGAAGNIVISVGTEMFTVPLLLGDIPSAVGTKAAAAINAVTTSKYAASALGAVLNVYPKASTVGNTATLALNSAGGTGVSLGSITSVSNTPVTDIAALEAAVPNAGVGITITGNPQAAAPFSAGIPIKYYAPRGTDMIVSLVAGFLCNGTATTTQELQYEEGAGYDVQYHEYVAGGWNGKPGPYRTSTVTGLPRDGAEIYAVVGTQYNILNLEYDLKSVAGWKEYESPLRTEVAIACTDTTTLTGLVAILDAITDGFGNLADDAALLDCTNTNVTTINNYATDGIESIA